MQGLVTSFLADTRGPSARHPYDDALARPTALIFADDAGRGARLTTIAEGHGLRAMAAMPVAAAAARLEWQASGIAILDLVEDDGAALDRLLDRVDAAASPVRHIVIAAVPLVDVAARLLDHPSATLLVDPDDGDVAAAIDMLLKPRVERVEDSSADQNGPRLRQLSEEIGRISRTLAVLSSGADAGAGAAVTVEPRGTASRLQTARGEIRLRRMREQFFDRSLFADPAWDMLLDLAAAELERRRVAVSSLCIAASVPATTALRWIAQMTEQGLLARYPDPDDGRRVFIALSEKASQGMTRYLDACAALRLG